jgi:prolyl-tRNA synthetase
MKLSEMFLPTLKESPAEAEIISHKLMFRAGLIRKLASGFYSFLPLGYRVIRRLENIVREEMDAKGAQELLLPILQPAELWKKSGRWGEIGEELIRLSDRNEREFTLGFTHEEVITDLVGREVRSYRDLPLLLYQIQVKFRDEIRPRFGLIRTREFIMKDAYSFDRDKKGRDRNYQKMHEAYSAIFTRCGLKFKVVEADPGLMGGDLAHEFMALANSGEDLLASCKECGYAANIERAQTKPEAQKKPAPEKKPLTEVKTPNIKTIEKLKEFLGKPPRDMVKTLFYQVDKETIAVLIRGDCQINETKLANYFHSSPLNLASEETIEKVSGAPLGFSGPLGLKVKIIADYSVRGLSNFIAGANKKDYHLLNVNLDRDFKVSEFTDLRLVAEADPCPRCQGRLNLSRGIEVGHIFKLGTKYSKSLGATYEDKKEGKKLIEMGCYGIGVSRMMAAIIEQNHDEKGIIWPFAVAPYQVLILVLNLADKTAQKLANQLYDSLWSGGIETLLDDREEQPGVKFNDADLIGIPLRITIGPRTLKEGKVELKVRQTGEEFKLEEGRVMDKIKELING